MSFNLFDAVKGLFTSELVGKASSYLGESESGVTKAIGGILPSLLSGFVNKAATTSGSTELLNAATEQHQSGIMENLGGFFGNDGGSNLNKGSKLLSSFFGDKANGLTGLISNFSGIKSSSANTLLSMAAPTVLGFLGKHATDNKLNASGLAGMLSSQKSNIQAAIPSGLNLSSVLGDWGSKTTTAVHDIKHTATQYTNEVKEKSGGGMRLLLPLLLLALTAAAVLYFWKGCNNDNDHTGGVTVKDSLTNIPSNSGDANTTFTAPSGKIVGDDYIYNEGDTITITLPNNAGDLKVGKYSTESKLITFLQDGNAKIDTVKGNWFEFTNVHFKTGSSDVTDASMQQLKNMAAITKGFPAAQFKLGGYTDNTGDSARNVVLSQKRADAVISILKKLGVAASSFTGAKGYGPSWPLADNGTPEGRAQNRRVAVNVKAKN